MSYNPANDFLALLRLTGGGVRSARMPGLDWFIEALQRTGLINLFVGQTAPTTNQTSTVWFKPALPTWSAEGAVFLWNATLGTFVPATPTLWTALFNTVVNGYQFQSVAGASANIAVGASIVAVQRTAPTATSLILPALGAQFALGARKIQIVDFSQSVANHDITISTPDGTTIMGSNTWQILSTAIQLAGIMLLPCPDLGTWVIAP